MRKADYQHLAAILARHYSEAMRASPDPIAIARAQACIDIARDFVRIASVDKAAFLRACGLE